MYVLETHLELPVRRRGVVGSGLDALDAIKESAADYVVRLAPLHPLAQFLSPVLGGRKQEVQVILVPQAVFGETPGSGQFLHKMPQLQLYDSNNLSKTADIYADKSRQQHAVHWLDVSCWVLSGNAGREVGC